MLNNTSWILKTTQTPLNLNQNTKMVNALNPQLYSIWKQKEEWLQLNHKEVVDLVSFSQLLLWWRVTSKLNSEKMSFYKNNSHLIVNLVQNMAKMDAMEEIHFQPLNSMLIMVRSQWIIIQSHINRNNNPNVRSTEPKLITKIKISF